eukprot:scaffold135782_cov133-Phaeocystis_antarctica.AAC.1
MSVAGFVCIAKSNVCLHRTQQLCSGSSYLPRHRACGRKEQVDPPSGHMGGPGVREHVPVEGQQGDAHNRERKGPAQPDSRAGRRGGTKGRRRPRRGGSAK